MKGLKGTIISATDTQVFVDVHCKGTRVMLDRQNVELVLGNRGGLFIQQNADMPMRLGFDEAANREYVNTGALLGPAAENKVSGGF